MLGNTITLTVGAGTKILNRVRENDFSSTYLLKETNAEVQLEIRHSLEKGVSGSPQMERHNVDLKFTTFDATTGKPTVRQTYTVMRIPKGTTPADVSDQFKSLYSYLVSNNLSIINWES
ncbi:MAG: putative coat protein [Whadcovirus faecenecus]|uniref:Coat protein n=1 Tax=Leviviridae sp. TaxID=2027243 RepID=A0ABY4D913_9VIRU|nr:MAG: putative coat protein [Leviviridae sp.]